MSKYLYALAGRDKHIFSLRIVIVALVVLLIFIVWGWKSAPDKLTIHIPPDLRSGSTRVWWDIDPSSIYAFSFYVFQQLNSWPKDGEIDYKRNIEAYSPYLTPQCEQVLLAEYSQRKNLGELKGRVRTMGEILGRGINSTYQDYVTKRTEPRVIVLSKDAWIVTFDLYVDEYFSGESIKRALVRYPLSVVRSDTNPELNPWGLKLNCYASKPLKLVMGEGNDK